MKNTIKYSHYRLSNLMFTLFAFRLKNALQLSQLNRKLSIIQKRKFQNRHFFTYQRTVVN